MSSYEQLEHYIHKISYMMVGVVLYCAFLTLLLLGIVFNNKLLFFLSIAVLIYDAIYCVQEYRKS